MMSTSSSDNTSSWSISSNRATSHVHHTSTHQSPIQTEGGLARSSSESLDRTTSLGSGGKTKSRDGTKAGEECYGGDLHGLLFVFFGLLEKWLCADSIKILGVMSTGWFLVGDLRRLIWVIHMGIDRKVSPNPTRHWKSRCKTEKISMWRKRFLYVVKIKIHWFYSRVGFSCVTHPSLHPTNWTYLTAPLQQWSSASP